jgi:succinoglycan biosynthesis transport protein ExoP
LPSRPYKPNRLAIMLLGFVLALAGGFGGVVFREASDHTIKSSKDINDIDGIELLTAMPYTPTEEELQLHRRKRLVLVTGGMGILGVVLIMIDRLIWPLRNIFSIVVDRLSY